MRRRYLIFFLLILLKPVIADNSSAEAFDFFERFAENLPMTQLKFEQRTYDSENLEIDQSQGILYFQSSNYFRLEYEREDIPLLVADGHDLWLYEADIKQAVARPLDSLEQVGLLDILSEGKIKKLEKRYVFSASLSREKVWLIAHTISDVESIRNVAFGFSVSSGQLDKIRVMDLYQGLIEMDIISTVHGSLPSELFQFIPPADVDVLKDIEQ